MRVTKYKTKLTNDGKATLTKEVSVNYPAIARKIDSPEKVARVAKEILHIHEETEEYLYMLCFNTKLVMTSVFEISHGNVNSSIVSPREVFQKALLANAVSIIMVHNHPSGDCTPSRQDVEITKRLVEAGKIVGVDVLDHIVVGETYCSIKEKGYI